METGWVGDVNACTAVNIAKHVKDLPRRKLSRFGVVPPVRFVGRSVGRSVVSCCLLIAGSKEGKTMYLYRRKGAPAGIKTERISEVPQAGVGLRVRVRVCGIVLDQLQQWS